MKYGIILCSVWDDPKFCGLTDNGKLVLIYLWTHQQRNSCGIYRGTIASIGALSPKSQEDFEDGFIEILNKGFAFYDKKNKIILLHNYVKYCQPGNPNIMKSWLPVLKTIPDSEIKQIWLCETMDGLERESYKELLSELFPKPFAEKKTLPIETVSETISQKGKKVVLKKTEKIAKKPKAPKLTDEEFIDSLRKNTAYRDIDLDVELGKMDSWLAANPRRQKTRRFIVNWLNRATENMRPVNTIQSTKKLTQQGLRNANLAKDMLKKAGKKNG